MTQRLWILPLAALFASSVAVAQDSLFLRTSDRLYRIGG